MSRRRQKWQEQRAQGYGPGLQRNLVDAEHPQPPAVAPALGHIEWSAINDPTSWNPPSDVVVIDADKAGDPCPKCGRPLKKQGRHLHVNRCKGALSDG